MIFETHAHYDDERFEEDRDALITSMPERGVGTIINVGASIESTKTTLALSEKYPFVYAAVGVHPSDISGLNEETFAWLREQTKKKKSLLSERSGWIITGTKSRKYKNSRDTGLRSR